MERRAEEIFAKIDEMGHGSMLEGCIVGIDENWFQGRIADSAYDLERSFNRGERTIVGVSKFLEGNEEDQMDTLKITNADEKKQRERLSSVKQDRNEAAVQDALDRLAKDAVDTEVNLMPALIDASNVYATVGEMMNTMAGVFGRHVEVPTI
jgi:methylmalonyl-CoA mutase N-terminal domain/subunit